MKLTDFDLATARPEDMRPDAQFTENVMKQIITKRTLLHAWKGIVRRSPAMAALAGAIVIGVAAGTVYAASYLWPQLDTSVSSPEPSASGRMSVFATDCDTTSKGKRYEVKRTANLPGTEVATVVKAQCELDAISKWASQTYRNQIEPGRPDHTPGKEITRVITFPIPAAYTVTSITESRLEMRDNTTDSNSFALTPNTQYIVNAQYAKRTDISRGDLVAYVTRDTVTIKNSATCTEQSCSADIVSESSELVAVIKLQYPKSAYDNLFALAELIPCEDNPKDYCVTGGSSVDLYANYIDQEGTEGILDGVIQSYNASAIKLKTTSGRIVTVQTPHNIIDQFNAIRSSDYYGLTIKVGDTLNIRYLRAKQATREPSTITASELRSINLVTEINSKADPLRKY